jgi:uncharacterized membrane protein
VSSITMIVTVRAVHVIFAVAWAGAMFVLATIIAPIALRHDSEGAGRWTGMINLKLGPILGIAGMLTVLSGIYLMVVLHGQDETMSGLVLKAGAVAALLALLLGLIVGRPTGLKLVALNASAEGVSSPEAAALRRRVLLTSRVIAVLLVISALSMGVFRYAGAVG